MKKHYPKRFSANHRKKVFKAYLLEFITIFLSVTSDFYEQIVTRTYNIVPALKLRFSMVTLEVKFLATYCFNKIGRAAIQPFNHRGNGDVAKYKGCQFNLINLISFKS